MYLYYKKQELLLIVRCTAQRAAPFIRSKGQLLISYIISLQTTFIYRYNSHLRQISYWFMMIWC